MIDTLEKSFKAACLMLLLIVGLISSSAYAQSISTVITLAGSMDPGDVVNVSVTTTCNDPNNCLAETAFGETGLITVTGPATPTSINILPELGFFTNGSSVTRTFPITINAGASQGDTITINATQIAFCFSLPGGAANCTASDSTSFTVTPVLLSSFSSRKNGKQLRLDFSTESELFNIGFRLWGLDGVTRQWLPLKKFILPSHNSNSLEVQDYSKTIKIPRRFGQLIAVGLSSVDSDGTEHHYGPFELGKAYGGENNLEPIDWEQVRTEIDEQMYEAGYTSHLKRGYIKQASLVELQDAEQAIEFGISRDGVYRITSEELIAQGIDWSEVKLNNIALVNAFGQPIARFAKSSTKLDGHKVLGKQGQIVFYGSAPDQTSGIYTGESIYRLIKDPVAVRKAQKQLKQNLEPTFPDSYQETILQEDNRLYLLDSQVDDPWVHGLILSQTGKPRSAADLFDLPDDVLAEGKYLHVQSARTTALPAQDDNNDGQQDAEYLLQGVMLDTANQPVYLNTESAVGKGNWNLSFPIPSDVSLNLDSLLVGVILSTGVGYEFAQLHLDSLGLSYRRPFLAKQGDDFLTFEHDETEHTGYQVTLPKSGKPSIFASDGSNLVKIQLESKTTIKSETGEKQHIIKFLKLGGADLAADDEPIRYWVTNQQGYLNVDYVNLQKLADSQMMIDSNRLYDYLIIAHPALMSESLQSFVQHKNAIGYNVGVVDYLAIQSAFGGNQPGPHGLIAFLEQLRESDSLLKYVLLVGGSTYDHRNYLGTDAVTLIPSDYAASTYSNFTATDSLYVQDEQGEFFAAIGRWPARTQEEVAHIVNQTIQWETQSSPSSSTLLIAEHIDPAEQIDFAKALDSLKFHLPDETEIDEVYIEEIMVDNPDFTLAQAINEGKSQIQTHLKNGPDWVLFNGHASTRQLSNDKLYHANDVTAMTATNPSFWLPLACYVSYHESTHTNTLAHQLMFTGNAVTITGSTLLSGHGDNLQLARELMNNLFVEGEGIGQAVNNAKTSLSLPEVNVNWGLLGDPSLRSPWLRTPLGQGELPQRPELGVGSN